MPGHVRLIEWLGLAFECGTGQPEEDKLAMTCRPTILDRSSRADRETKENDEKPGGERAERKRSRG